MEIINSGSKYICVGILFGLLHLSIGGFFIRTIRESIRAIDDCIANLGLNEISYYKIGTLNFIFIIVNSLVAWLAIRYQRKSNSKPEPPKRRLNKRDLLGEFSEFCTYHQKRQSPPNSKPEKSSLKAAPIDGRKKKVFFSEPKRTSTLKKRYSHSSPNLSGVKDSVKSKVKEISFGDDCRKSWLQDRVETSR